MEARTITIISESGNGHKTIQSSAETLGELKRDLAQNGIDYEGKTFREGLSRTELVDDASVLPRDLDWKGAKTNNLVFTLTTANKKIRSGAMSRPETYEAVKKAGLQDAIKAKFGKNFTQVGTADLEAFLSKKAPKVAPEAPKSEKAKAKPEVAACPIEDKFNALIEVLVFNGTLEDYEAEEILDKVSEATPTAPKSDSPYSEAELRALAMR
nr:MAG TPA: hypothetical protein [Crassvirales sp.]